MNKHKIIIVVLFILVFCVACQINTTEDKTQNSITEKTSTNETQAQERSSSKKESSDLIKNEDDNLLTLKSRGYPLYDRENGVFESREAEDIQIFNEFFDEAFELEVKETPACFITDTLYSGNKCIEIFDCGGEGKGRKTELWFNMYLDGEANIRYPARIIYKEDLLYTKLWDLIEKLEQTENLYEQTEDIK